MAELLGESWWVLILGVVFIAGISFSAPKRRKQSKGSGDGTTAIAAGSTAGDGGPGDAGGCDGGGD